MLVENFAEKFATARPSDELGVILSQSSYLAQKLGSSFVTTGHLLRTLFVYQDKEIKWFLGGQRFDHGKFLHQVEESLPKSEQPFEGALKYNDLAEKTLEKAITICNKEGAKSLTPLHLLRGMLNTHEGSAWAILYQNGVRDLKL
ncbi:MAG: Clp protease N-terminal domain-containing protein [Microgenomates group bacterium]|jgi:ATP-dependent Clp protease ATP-binding subunit ClpA